MSSSSLLSSNILAAIDKAISDNVNVLSMSLGGGMSYFYRDGVAIRDFAAMERVILVSCSAGNAGPSVSSLSNVAPWIRTVGAGTIDRDFPVLVILGNGKNFTGVLLFKVEALHDRLLPFIYGDEDVGGTVSEDLTTAAIKPNFVLC